MDVGLGICGCQVSTQASYVCLVEGNPCKVWLSCWSSAVSIMPQVLLEVGISLSVAFLRRLFQASQGFTASCSAKSTVKTGHINELLHSVDL